MWTIYINLDLTSTHISELALDDVTEDFVFALTEEHGPLVIEIEDDEDRKDRYINWSKIK